MSGRCGSRTDVSALSSSFKGGMAVGMWRMADDIQVCSTSVQPVQFMLVRRVHASQITVKVAGPGCVFEVPAVLRHSCS